MSSTHDDAAVPLNGTEATEMNAPDRRIPPVSQTPAPNGLTPHDVVPAENTHPFDSFEYIRPVLRRWWLVLGLVLVVAGATYAYYQREAPVYQASSQLLLVQNSTAISNVLGTPAIDPTRLDTDAATVIRSPRVAVQAARILRYRGDPAALAGAVSVQTSPSSDFLTITAQAGSAARTADIANAFVRGYIRLLTGGAVAQARQAAALTERQLATLKGSSQASERATLQQQLSQLRILERAPQAGAQQISTASPPVTPISPRPRQDAEFAAAIALLVGILLCYLLERIDRRIKRIDELESLLGARVLAAVPHASTASAHHGDAATIDQSITEPFRMLRATVRLSSSGQEVKTVLVTSGLPGEGKSTVARNLALAYCETGLSVLIVDCDLRGPVMDRILSGSSQHLGLTDVLAGETSAEEAIIKVGAEVLQSGAGSPLSARSADGAADEVTIDMMPAGHARANPATVLETSQFRDLLARFRNGYDMVILDSAPVLPVSDTLPLISLVDGILLVGRTGVLTRGGANRVAEVVRQARPRQVLGVVANDFPGSELGSYGTSYYGDTYGYAGVRQSWLRRRGGRQRRRRNREPARK